MKKTLFIFALTLYSLLSFAQFTEDQYDVVGNQNIYGSLWIDNTLELGTFWVRWDEDSAWLEKPYGTWIAPMSHNAPLETYETTSRTINVGASETYTTILTALQSCGDVWLNSIITINLVDATSYNWTQDCIDVVQRIEAYNSSLVITSTSTTVILDAVSLSKKSDRLFAYTMTKTGTYAENQFRSYWMTNATQTEYYPICHNDAGTDAIEIEFTHDNKAALTRIVSFNTTLTNACASVNWLDFGFKNSVNSSISFSNMTLDNTTSYYAQFILYNTPKNFTNVKFIGKGVNISSGTDVYKGASIDVTAAQFINTASDGSCLYLNETPALISKFQRCLFLGTGITNGVVTIKGKAQRFTSGNYFYGKITVPVFLFSGSGGEIQYHKGIVCRDARSFVYFTNGNKVLPYDATVSHEFINVAYLFGNLPLFGCKVDVTTIYGSLPGIFYGISTGYKFVSPAEDINLHVTGLYGELEKGIPVTLTDNTTTDVIMGLTTQNTAIWVEYRIARNGGNRVGRLQLMYDGTSFYMSPDEFITNGAAGVNETAIVFSPYLDGTNLKLRAVLNSTGSNAILSYNVARIMN